MAEAENKAKFAAEQLAQAQIKTNEALFQGATYEEELAIARENLAQADITLKNIDLKLTEAKEKLAKAETSEATNPRSIGGLTASVNNKQRKADEAALAVDSATKRVKSLEVIKQHELEVRRILEEEVKIIQTLTTEERQQVNIEKTLEKFVSEKVVSLQKELKEIYDSLSMEEKRVKVNQEVVKFKEAAMEAAEQEAAALKQAIEAEESAKTAKAEGERLRKQGERETKAETITRTLGDVTSIVFGYQMLSEAIKTCTDDSISLEEKISAIAMNGLMGISMLIPALTSLSKTIKETAIVQELLNIAQTQGKKAILAEIAARLIQIPTLVTTKSVTLAASLGFIELAKAEGAAGIAAVSAITPLGIIVGILAGIAAIAGVVVIAMNAMEDGYNKFGKAVDTARSNLMMSNKNLEETTNSLNSLKNSLDELEQDQDAFNGLTKGTQE